VPTLITDLAPLHRMTAAHSPSFGTLGAAPRRASTGIGHSAVFALAREGDFTVYAGVRNEADATRLAAEAARATGTLRGTVQPLVIDVTDSASIEAAAAVVEKAGKPLVALVNNAGGSLCRSLLVQTFPGRNIASHTMSVHSTTAHSEPLVRGRPPHTSLLSPPLVVVQCSHMRPLTRAYLRCPRSRAHACVSPCDRAVHSMFDAFFSIDIKQSGGSGRANAIHESEAHQPAVAVHSVPHMMLAACEERY
jgi:hypothetical protein